MATNNHQELIDWAKEQDDRLCYVLTKYKRPLNHAWQEKTWKAQDLEAQLEITTEANALGINLGQSRLIGLDFDADDWPQQFADLAGETVKESNRLIREQTYVISPKTIADGKTPRVKVVIPMDDELTRAFVKAAGTKNKVTESNNGGIGIFAGTGVQFAVFGPYRDDKNPTDRDWETQP